MAEHTEGPWSHNGLGVVVAMVAGQRRQVACVTGDAAMHEQPERGSAPEIRDANARLVAAAPQLLEACMALMVKARHSSACASVCGVDGDSAEPCDCGIDEAYEKARAAIAAAREGGR